MTADASEASSGRTYELTCTGCQFETVVEGDALEALDVAEAHEETHGTASGHFVNLVYVGE